MAAISQMTLSSVFPYSRKAMIRSNDGLGYWRINAILGLDELKTWVQLQYTFHIQNYPTHTHTKKKKKKKKENLKTYKRCLG